MIEFKLVEHPKQRHLENLLVYVQQEEPGGMEALFGPGKPMFRPQGVIARAAIRAGWVAEPQDITPDSIGDWEWTDVDRLAQEVLDVYRRVVIVDPNS